MRLASMPDSFHFLIDFSMTLFDAGQRFKCSARTSLHFGEVLKKFRRVPSQDSELSESELSVHDVGFCPYVRSLRRDWTIEENLRFQGRLHRMSDTLIESEYPVSQ